VLYASNIRRFASLLSWCGVLQSSSAPPPSFVDKSNSAPTTSVDSCLFTHQGTVIASAAVLDAAGGLPKAFALRCAGLCCACRVVSPRVCVSDGLKP